ncbi:histidinol-phosphate transaminase [Rhizobium sp. AG855]|uniref:histidinol-phosphate transaminase n=1 Tax=Rhizobium sp. AG855 TaxID=2183898 RepID=UPI000FF75A3A|nr:histidinol-phosphate transaminase [Rhizobium sp. AG855]RKE77379.1 histidinol-phosphate aminotransferase [Rhizobium sp. AG855]
MDMPRKDITLNPHVAALPPYNAGMNIAAARKLSGRDDIAALASNENPDGCSPKVMAALADLNPSRYSDPACTTLRGALSAKVGVASDRIVIGNGSEDMIAAICRAVLCRGAPVATVSPGFGLHEIEALANGATVDKVPMRADLDFDVPAIVAALSKAPAIFFLSSPSNPVGPALSTASLEQILAAVSHQTLLVLDEAYFEYADDETPDGLELLSGSGLNYVVLRTFSKAYGLAGLRVGYAVFSDDRLARAVSSSKTPFNVNSAAQIAAVAALDDDAWMKSSVASMTGERARVAEALVSMGLRAAKSQTNFLFIDVGLDSQKAFDHLLSRGIIVKPWKEKGYETFIRMTIGTPAENDRFIAALHMLIAR